MRHHPQAFQTGETFRRAPLIDYQHPHDLIMGLGAAYSAPWRRITWRLSGAVVGSPAFGPLAFMHRSSAADNPQSPLSHHYLDSTHITPGVATVGATAGEWTVEGSWFKGREPDENRTDLDLGALDSYSLRLGWTRGAWSAQASGAALTMPALVTPYDAKRLSASLSYEAPGGRRLAWTAAFGQNREIHGNLEAYLFEGRLQVRPRDARLGIGGDVTGYLVPDNLREAYGSPASFHVFLRYRPGRGDHPGVTHVH